MAKWYSSRSLTWFCVIQSCRRLKAKNNPSKEQKDLISGNRQMDFSKIQGSNSHIRRFHLIYFPLAGVKRTYTKIFEHSAIYQPNPAAIYTIIQNSIQWRRAWNFQMSSITTWPAKLHGKQYSESDYHMDGIKLRVMAIFRLRIRLKTWFWLPLLIAIEPLCMNSRRAPTIQVQNRRVV